MKDPYPAGGSTSVLLEAEGRVFSGPGLKGADAHRVSAVARKATGGTWLAVLVSDSESVVLACDGFSSAHDAVHAADAALKQLRTEAACAN